MTDDELRRTLAQAHRDEAPPSLGAILARPRPRRRRIWLALAVPAAALLVAVVLRATRPAVPPPVAQLDLSWSRPLDFLLDVPGQDLLRETPSFDLKGTLP